MNEENKHEDYQNLLYRLFDWYAKGYYDVALPRRSEMKDYTDIFHGNVDSFYDAIKFLKMNVNLHEIYRLPWTFTLSNTKYEKSVTVVADFERKTMSSDEDDVFDKSKVVVDVKIEPYPVDELDCEVQYTCPNCQLHEDPYYLVDDIENYLIKERKTDEVVVTVRRNKLRDWEAFKVASDATNYLNLSEEKKYTPEFIRNLEKAHEIIEQVLNDCIKKWKETEKRKDWAV